MLNLRAKGLYTYPNNLSEIPEGALSVANNVNIGRDGVIDPRRGFKIYGNVMGSSPTTDQAKQLFEYRSRILRHYDDVLQFDSDNSGTFSSFNGSYSETETGLRIKSVESNGNFYFTTDAGIKKISALNSSQFSTAAGYIVNAGIPKALDLDAKLNPNPGFFTQDSVVGYRIIWGIKDANNNLPLGSPSQRVIIYNPITTLLLQDLNKLLKDLDTAAAADGGDSLSDTDYLSTLRVTLSDDASTIRTRLISLTTKLDADIGGATYSGITQPAAPSVPPTTAELEAIQAYFDDIVDALNADAGISAAAKAAINNGFGFLSSTQSQTVDLTFTIPNDITTTHFYQIYRTAVKQSTGTTVLQDLDPGDEMGLVFESNPTSAEITAREITVTDITPDSFRGLNLYTNPNSGEGILQANDPPPFAKDVCLFKGSVLYANTRTKHKLTISLLGTPTDSAREITEITCVAQALLNDGEYFTLNSANNEQKYYFWFNVTGAGVDPAVPGRTGVEVDLTAAVSATDVAVAIKNEINSVLYFYASNSSAVLTVQNILMGPADDAQEFVSDAGFTINVTQQGLGNDEKFTIAKNSTANTYTFKAETFQSFKINCVSGAELTAVGTGDYFDLFSTKDLVQYRFWYNVDAGNTAPSNVGVTLVEIAVGSVDTSTTIATKTKNNINTNNDFDATSASNIVSVSNSEAGIASFPTENVADTDFSIKVSVQGEGEDQSNNYILYSILDTPAQRVDETARSIVRVINKNASEVVNAFYLSGPADIPGKILLESRFLDLDTIYIVANSSELGERFNPDISPSNFISNISVANPTVITSTSHGLTTGDQIVISGSNSTPSVDGIYTVTVTGVNTFTVPVNVTVAGNSGAFDKLSVAIKTDNEENPHQIWWSKTDQPEAVPIVNNGFAGGKDYGILRIIALRDSVFILKGDAVYRLTGEVPSQFNISLFDSSSHLNCPDSAVSLNNQIFCLTDAGVTVISDTGIDVVSRSIEDLFVKLMIPSFTNFDTATFGVAYELDKSYLIWTVTNPTDTKATQCFRYNYFTNSWTRWNTTKTCGLVKRENEKLYLGAGDTNSIEEERKSFTRKDHSDREYNFTLSAGSVDENVLTLPSATNVAVDDAIVQTQYLTISQFNRLLRHLDLDPKFTSTSNNDYETTLEASPGDSLSAKLVALAAKLDADPTDGGYAAIIGAPNDSNLQTLQTLFNDLVDALNLDSNLILGNYQQSTGSVEIESIIVNFDTVSKEATMYWALPYVAGPITLYKHIETEIGWVPQHFGAPDILKQVAEATYLFERSNFIGATASYSSDLDPGFEEIDFELSGSGEWGFFNWGLINWGGNGNFTPLRTFVPANKQRCRFINCKFKHNHARQRFSIYGLSLTSRTVSTRAYR